LVKALLMGGKLSLCRRLNKAAALGMFCAVQQETFGDLCQC
jgi:hypothetical protein